MTQTDENPSKSVQNEDIEKKEKIVNGPQVGKNFFWKFMVKLLGQ
jgi:hypothetical protein